MGIDHGRALRATLVVTALFCAALIVWMTILHPRAPEGALAFEIAILVFGYAFLLGLGLMWAQRGSRGDRRLRRHGYEGWATITTVRPLQKPQITGELTEIELRLVVPGATPYAGRLVRMLDPYERNIFVPGATLPIRVDPRDRDHIMVQPQIMPQ
ncbi:MAG: hypothetical protein L0H64_15785 [Pseudonocardia sp.]|nr:hypothetical protein [Pseudonocardia sp.]